MRKLWGKLEGADEEAGCERRKSELQNSQFIFSITVPNFIILINIKLIKVTTLNFSNNLQIKIPYKIKLIQTLMLNLR